MFRVTLLTLRVSFAVALLNGISLRGVSESAPTR